MLLLLGFSYFLSRTGIVLSTSPVSARYPRPFPQLRLPPLRRLSKLALCSLLTASIHDSTNIVAIIESLIVSALLPSLSHSLANILKVDISLSLTYLKLDALEHNPLYSLAPFETPTAS
jgi:hypothetical protein